MMTQYSEVSKHNESSYHKYILKHESKIKKRKIKSSLLSALERKLSFSERMNYISTYYKSILSTIGINSLIFIFIYFILTLQNKPVLVIFNIEIHLSNNLLISSLVIASVLFIYNFLFKNTISYSAYYYSNIDSKYRRIASITTKLVMIFTGPFTSAILLLHYISYSNLQFYIDQYGKISNTIITPDGFLVYATGAVGIYIYVAYRTFRITQRFQKPLVYEEDNEQANEPKPRSSDDSDDD